MVEKDGIDNVTIKNYKIMEEIIKIEEYVNEIFDLVDIFTLDNKEAKEYLLLFDKFIFDFNKSKKNKVNTDQIWGPLHILLLIQNAKKKYLKLDIIDDLSLIGLLQTLYIEQDSLSLFAFSIGYIDQRNKFETDIADFKEIRYLRNEAFGHPSTTDRNTVHLFKILDSKKQSFEVHNWEKNNKMFSNEIFCLLDIFKKHNSYSQRILLNLKNHINKAFLEMQL